MTLGPLFFTVAARALSINSAKAKAENLKINMLQKCTDEAPLTNVEVHHYYKTTVTSSICCSKSILGITHLKLEKHKKIRLKTIAAKMHIISKEKH